MLTVRVLAIASETEEVRSFVLAHPNGERLPTFEPGAHIDVQIPGGFTRQYSLCDAPWELHYRIAVLNVAGGRGGSAAMHQRVRQGDLLQISKPRNMFPLVNGARHSIFIAGGIGITPILPMVRTLQHRNASFELHYCTKSPDRTPFLDEIQRLVQSQQASLHHDAGNVSNHLNVAALLQNYQEGQHLYFCGPAGFMGALRVTSQHWPRHTVHWEYFGAEPTLDNELGIETSFDVRLSHSNRVIHVAHNETILSAVRNAGVDWESSCEAGVCGTCRVRYLSGNPEHNDFLLSEDERREFVLICCARTTDDSLVLDM